MTVVNPSFGNGALAAIENLRVQIPGKTGATSTEFRNLHEPLMTFKVRMPFEGLRNNLLNWIFVFGGIVVVEIHAPVSGMVVAEKYVLDIELSRPLVMVIE